MKSFFTKTQRLKEAEANRKDAIETYAGACKMLGVKYDPSTVLDCSTAEILDKAYSYHDIYVNRRYEKALMKIKNKLVRGYVRAVVVALTDCHIAITGEDFLHIVRCKKDKEAMREIYLSLGGVNETLAFRDPTYYEDTEE